MYLDYLSIGKTIRNYRIEQGSTQEQLSESVGITPGYLSKIEVGNSKPSLEILVQIAYSLGVSLDDLVFTYKNIDNFDLYKRKIIELVDELTITEKKLVYSILFQFVSFLTKNGVRM